MEFPRQEQPNDDALPDAQSSGELSDTVEQPLEAPTGRRTFLRKSLVLPVAVTTGIGGLSLVGLISSDASAQPAIGDGSVVHLEPTPVCADHDELTPEQIEGPYFKPRSPLRTNLRQQGVWGINLELTGYVLSTTCQPVAHALLDFWHANSDGVYDNVGYTLRGHQYSNRQGLFHLETIIPGIYPGRTRHIHVKVQAPHKPILTTQLYFPWETRLNASDLYYRKECLMSTKDTDPGEFATFSFVLNVP